MATVCQFIIGSKNVRFSTKYPFLTQRPGYGSGSDKSEAYWRALGRFASVSTFGLLSTVFVVNIVAQPRRRLLLTLSIILRCFTC